MSSGGQDKDDKGLVLVSGASGYVASHVVREFLDNGYRVRGTVRDLASKASHLESWASEGDPLELVQADLTDPDSWNRACEGCDFVAHVASPFFVGCSDADAEEKLYIPARTGTLNVLKAAKHAKSVKRVVLTSSMAAIGGGHSNEELESDPEILWTDENSADPYSKSKTMAEKAAWEFVREHPSAFELAVVNPTLVVGPPLSPGDATSHEIVRRLVMRQMPGVPDLEYTLVDVRDVARAHRLAIEVPEAANQRYALVGGLINFLDWAKILHDDLKPLGYNPPTRKLPYVLLWLVSWFDAGVRTILPSVGKPAARTNCEKVEQQLGLQFRDLKSTLIDHAHACISQGTPGFKMTAAFKAAEAKSTSHDQ
mmetsp:Transcript_456/g.1102  ORF Transcript_456/g.1102 Transcript_456/m.1102 type:complete len:369 (+) Transcript_456:127-1233(+)